MNDNEIASLFFVLGVGPSLGEVGADELGHGEGADAVLAEDLGHLLVGEEVLLVLRVLQVVLLEVGPQLLDALGPRKERIRLIK